MSGAGDSRASKTLSGSQASYSATMRRSSGMISQFPPVLSHCGIRLSTMPTPAKGRGTESGPIICGCSSAAAPPCSVATSSQEKK